MVSIDDNSLLDEWLNNKKDDLTPYYFNKLEFLKLYGTRCSTQTKPEDCTQAKTEDECIGGRELYCQYSNEQCVDVIDSICNYYDEKGYYTKEKWGKDQVEYIDRLYKTGGLFEYGKVIYDNDEKKINQTIKTNAFQIIYNKFNTSSEQYYNKKGCFSAINNLIKANDSVMTQIHAMRKKIFDKLKLGYDNKAEDNNTIKLIEISVYVYEVLYNDIVTKTDNFSIFKHDTKLDAGIIAELRKEGICVQNTNPKKNTKPIPSNLFSLKLDDFNYKIPTHSLLFNVMQWSYDVAKRSVYGVGNLILNTGVFLINNYGNIAIVIFGFVLVHQILAMLVDFDSINIFGLVFEKMDIGNNHIINIEQLKKIMPYLNVLYTHCRNLLCLLIPVLNNVSLIHANIGLIIGDEATRMYFNKSIFSTKIASFIAKLKNIAFIETLIHVLKNDFLHCGQKVRAIGKERNLVYVDDKESDLQRWRQFIVEQWKNGTTHMSFKLFVADLFEDPLKHIKTMYLVLNSIITRSYLQENNTDDINTIAKECVELLYVLFIEGPFAQETGVQDLAGALAQPFRQAYTNINNYDIYKRFNEIITFDILFFVALSSGMFAGYLQNEFRKGYVKGKEETNISNTPSKNPPSSSGGSNKKKSKKRTSKKRTSRKTPSRKRRSTSYKSLKLV
jgi:hypothetical protein